MNGALRVGLFALGVAALFGLAAWAGSLLRSDGGSASARPGMAGHSQMGSMIAATPEGLTIADDGYVLRPENTRLHDHGDPVLHFTISGPDGKTVTRFSPVRGFEMHLVVIRRDLSGYLHVQPTRSADGVWSVPLRLPAPGSYRAYALFLPTAAGRPLVLGADLVAGGFFSPQSVPPPSRETRLADDLEVTVGGWLNPGRTSRLTFSFSRDGHPVTDLEPYHDAHGQLVVLRDGDLAVLESRPVPGAAGPDTGYDLTVPSTGTYRAFLDFKYRGTVRTAAFTLPAGP